MPVSLLTKADRVRLTGFPEEIPMEELYAHFSLTGWDRSTVPSKGSPMNRLGYALSLCAVRRSSAPTSATIGGPGLHEKQGYSDGLDITLGGGL